MATLVLEVNAHGPIPTREHLVALLDNALVILDRREQRAIEKAKFGTYGAYVGHAGALERAHAYSESRPLVLDVLDG